MEKTKRIYQKPSMKVIELTRQPRLLVGSGEGTRNPYGTPIPLGF